MLMEGNGASQHSPIEDSTTEDNEKPPPWDTMDDDQVYSNEIRELLGEDTVISREDIENSLKKYEELSRQLNETKRSLEQYEGGNDVEEEDRRNSLGASTDGEGEHHLLHIDHDDHDTHLLDIDLHRNDHHPLHSSDHEIHHHHTYPVSGNGSEEERSKSDDDKDELMGEREKHEQEEERSKSDGDKDELLEEDDEDDVPLRIQAAHKSSKLTLSNCWLKTIPSEVWDLTHLTELDLSANYLKKVSKSIGNLTLLKRLRLNHNQLTILPKEMWTLTKLTTLLLNNNNLKMIPKEIKHLTKLKTLDLSSNQLAELPIKDSIMQLPSLAELRLRNNQIAALPACMTEMTQLQVLWLEGNPMPVPKTVLKRNASGILSYMKDHPNFAKRPSVDAGNPRILRKSPPSNTPTSNVHGQAPAKKDFGILAEKELKKRKREQLEEMRKHLEVEKKVKHLEHELMLANAKALKYEEEARKPEPPVHQQQAPQLLAPQQTQPQPMSPIPSPFPGVQFGTIPPHVPRQQGQMVIPMQLNDYKPYPPLPQLVQVQQQQQQLQQQQQPQNQFLAPNTAPANTPTIQTNFEWEIPLLELSFGPRIGRGGYGEVYRGMWGGTEVAVKMLFTDNMNAKLLDDLRKEVDLLCKLRHPNIILFMGACTEPVTPCIVTDYLARGSLANILMDQTIQMDWGLILQVGMDTARGMAYLHSRNPVIIHRDLKTDNLLVDENWQVKVADFGLATVKSRTFAKTMCGTTGWVAPEVLAEQGYTEKADVYSFAIILWELLTRQIPYAGKNTMQVVRSVDRGERLAIPPTCPPDYAKLISECWDNDPSTRPAFTSILTTLERMRTEYFAQKAAASALPPPAATTLPEPTPISPTTSPEKQTTATDTTTLPEHHPPLPDGAPGTHTRLIADNSLT